MERVSFSAGYVCGVVCSHGVIAWNERSGNYSLSIESSNRELIDVFAENLSNVVNKKPKIWMHRRKRDGKIVHMNMLTLYGKKIIEELRDKWGLTYGKKWSVPRRAFEDVDFRRGFVMGFFDGGGHVSSYIENRERKVKRRLIVVYSINKKGLNELRNLLKIDGIQSVIHKAGDCFSLKIRGKTRIETFSKNIGFGITSKKQAVDNILSPLSVHE